MDRSTDLQRLFLEVATEQQTSAPNANIQRANVGNLADVKSLWEAKSSAEAEKLRAAQLSFTRVLRQKLVACHDTHVHTLHTVLHHLVKQSTRMALSRAHTTAKAADPELIVKQLLNKYRIKYVS